MDNYVCNVLCLTVSLCNSVSSLLCVLEYVMIKL
jgi:hypothetical protein